MTLADVLDQPGHLWWYKTEAGRPKPHNSASPLQHGLVYARASVDDIGSHEKIVATVLNHSPATKIPTAPPPLKSACN